MKTGLYFGSFNPIHIGHMAIANYLAINSDLDQIWFVVTPQNPLKERNTLLQANLRLQLVIDAIADDSRFKASNIEFALPQPNYTVNTLAYLSEKYPARQFALILGADNLQTIHKWKNYEYLLTNFDCYIYPRIVQAASPAAPAAHASPAPPAPPAPHSLPPHLSKRLIYVNAPIIEISSTFIRKAIREKKDVRHFLPSSVYLSIQAGGYYR